MCPYLDAKECRQASEAKGLAIGKGGWPFKTTCFLPRDTYFYCSPSADESRSNAAFFGTGAFILPKC
jgi:hypothetical protein